VEVAHADSNSHWENADGFGVAKLIDTTGYVAIDNQETKEASAFHLAQNYPNPFNPTTTISYSLPKNVNVNLTVYNITGQKVAELINEYQTAGQHRVQWNAGNFASGIYYYKLTAGKFSTAKRCLLMK
jgi:flagellar hook assembly protein FlgD